MGQALFPWLWLQVLVFPSLSALTVGGWELLWDEGLSQALCWAPNREEWRRRFKTWEGEGWLRLRCAGCPDRVWGVGGRDVACTGEVPLCKGHLRRLWGEGKGEGPL